MSINEFLNQYNINNSSTLVKIQRPDDADLIRKAMIANALSIIDISASDKLTRKIFETILGPTNVYGWDLNRPYKCWKENGQFKTQGVSTCGLTVRGLYRRMLVDMPPIYSAYKAGTAVAAEIMFARANGAWQVPWKNTDLRPQPGDAVIIGVGLQTHEFTCIGWKDENVMISVDGGSVDKKNLQCVKYVERTWNIKNKEAFLNDRKVLGWIVVDMLPFRNGMITTAQGWENVSL